jgi:N-acetylmuramic acid 6-phosphate etherase
MANASNPPPRLWLGIDGGGTRTTALLADSSGRLLGRLEVGPANLRLLTDAQLTRQFRRIAAAFPRPTAAGIGLAGAWAEAERRRIRLAAAKVWPGMPCCATHDLETTLAAAIDPTQPPPPAQVLIICGTGSSCYGTSRAGRIAKVGGWGHVLGDCGSGYDIGLNALRMVARHYDETSAWPDLGARLLRALQLNEPNDLIDWAQAASKADLAGLAPEIFDAWDAQDKLAAGIMAAAAHRLAADGAHCARKLAAPGDHVRFVLAGGILLKRPRFRAQVARQLRRLCPGAAVVPLPREAAWGGITQARRMVEAGAGFAKAAAARGHRPEAGGRKAAGGGHGPERAEGGAQVSSAGLSPTEERNPRSLKLDRLPLAQAVSLMLTEEATVPRKLLRERRRLARAVRAIVRAFQRGGRLFYAGAGTSGRIGVLDASECPPTFGTPPSQVQGILAGGQEALWRSVEGAEDDAAAGRRAAEFRGVGRQDVLVGIAASGTTPFVWGALAEAKQRGATTILLCFNPRLKIPPALRPALVIAPNLGPEVLTGSTRLKAGTATKLVLNLLTTLSMVRTGKVMSNLMVDVNPANVKLRGRAVRIVRALTGSDEEVARQTLGRHGWRVKETVQALGVAGARRTQAGPDQGWNAD